MSHGATTTSIGRSPSRCACARNPVTAVTTSQPLPSNSRVMRSSVSPSPWITRTDGRPDGTVAPIIAVLVFGTYAMARLPRRGDRRDWLSWRRQRYLINRQAQRPAARSTSRDHRRPAVGACENRGDEERADRGPRAREALSDPRHHEGGE